MRVHAWMHRFLSSRRTKTLIWLTFDHHFHQRSDPYVIDIGKPQPINTIRFCWWEAFENKCDYGVFCFSSIAWCHTMACFLCVQYRAQHLSVVPSLTVHTNKFVRNRFPQYCKGSHCYTIAALQTITASVSTEQPICVTIWRHWIEVCIWFAQRRF